MALLLRDTMIRLVFVLLLGLVVFLSAALLWLIVVGILCFPSLWIPPRALAAFFFWFPNELIDIIFI